MREARSDVTHLSLANDRVQFSRSDELIWEVPVPEVRVIGEYTTEDGPWADDWFILLVGKDGNWFEAPVDAQNLDAVLAALGERLQTPITLGLANSASFQSRILWPSFLQGEQLLEFRSRAQDWVRQTAGFRRMEYSLTKAVVDSLE